MHQRISFWRERERCGWTDKLLIFYLWTVRFSHPFQGKKRILMKEHRNVVFSGLDNQ